MSRHLARSTVSRRPCSRCGQRPGHATWDVCSDGNRPRVLCWPCDLALNRLVLRWVRDPDWREKLVIYAATAGPKKKSARG